jgi:hypothetical protein
MACEGLHCPGCKEGAAGGGLVLLAICLLGAKFGEDVATILWECLIDVFVTALIVVGAMGLYARRTLRRMEPQVVLTQREVSAAQRQLGTHVSQRRAIAPATVVNNHYHLNLHGATPEEATAAVRAFRQRQQLPADGQRQRAWPRENRP